MPAVPILAEPFVRIDHSPLWRLHAAWWAERGAAPFATGEVPSLATSNGVAASERAAFYAALVARLTERGSIADDAPLSVLEIGAGDGRFAANFLRALAEGDAAARSLLARTRYLLTDASQRVVDEAAASPRLAPWVSAGVVRPARLALDAAAPAPTDAPLVLVIANYVASAVPAVHLQRHADGSYRTLMVQLSPRTPIPRSLADVDVEPAWEPVALDACCDDPRHAEVIGRLTRGLAEVTLAYPDRYIDFLLRLAPDLAPGGVIVTTDCGHADERALYGHFTPALHTYGGSLTEALHFPVLDAFAAALGWGVARTDEPLDPLHTAILIPSGPDAAVAAAFDAHLDTGRVMALMDTRAAGAYSLDDGEHRRALRCYLRCVAMDPWEPEHRYRVGLAAIADEYYALAIHHLLVGWDEDLERRWDIAFELGRAHALVGEPDAAVTWYRRSVEHAPHPVTWANLAHLLRTLGRDAEAAEAERRAAASAEISGR